MSPIKYCTLIWMFCKKCCTQLNKKLHFPNLHLIKELEDTSFKDLLLKGNS